MRAQRAGLLVGLVALASFAMSGVLVFVSPFVALMGFGNDLRLVAALAVMAPLVAAPSLLVLAVAPGGYGDRVLRATPALAVLVASAAPFAAALRAGHIPWGT